MRKLLSVILTCLVFVGSCTACKEKRITEDQNFSQSSSQNDSESFSLGSGHYNSINWKLLYESSEDNEYDLTLVLSGSGDTKWINDTTVSSSDAPWIKFVDSADVLISKAEVIKHLTHIVVEDGITTIGDYTFFNLDYLDSVEIAESVTKIGNNAFDDSGAPGGCKKIELPSHLTSIGNGAFYSLDVSELKIRGTITKIERATFGECLHLQRIEIPATVRTIGEDAFYRCEDLTDVYFTGSKEQWENIFFDADSDQKILQSDSVTIHFNSQMDD